MSLTLLTEYLTCFPKRLFQVALISSALLISNLCNLPAASLSFKTEFWSFLITIKLSISVYRHIASIVKLSRFVLDKLDFPVDLNA